MKPKKERLSLKHDADAASDPKIVTLISVHGFAGYGRYWRINEILRVEQTNRICLSGKYGYNVLAEELKIDVESTKVFIKECVEIGLYELDHGYLFANRILVDADKDKAKKEQTRLAAYASVEARKNNKAGIVKEKEAKPPAPPKPPKEDYFKDLSTEQIEDWQNFVLWIEKSDYTRVQSLKKPLTPQQLAKLLTNKKYTVELIRSTFKKMENWKPLTSKSVSAFLTLINWMDSELSKH